MISVPVGLAGYGIYTPADFETAEEIAVNSGLTSEDVVLKLGVIKKPRPSDEDQPGLMALNAARAALRKTPEIDPAKIDVVIWTGEEYKDHVCQTAGIRLQEEIGSRGAWSFDLVGQGTTLLTGFRVASDLMAGDENVSTVLLAGGTRNVDLVDFQNPDTRWLLAFAAGGGAVILRRGLEKNRLLGWNMVVDPDMADEVFVPGGGTLIPFSPENLGTAAMYFQESRPEQVASYLESEYPGCICDAVQGAMADAGLDGQKPDYLALRHMNPGQRRTVLSNLGLSEEQSLSLADWGHIGPVDPLLSLDMGLKKGRVQPGSKVVLAAAGTGFTYVAAVIEWS